MTLMKLRLEFLFTDLLQHFGIHSEIQYSWAYINEDLISSVQTALSHHLAMCCKSKVIQPQTKHKSRNIQNLIKKYISETFIETKSKLQFQILAISLWSDCKHHNTFEFLICVFPVQE